MPKGINSNLVGSRFDKLIVLAKSESTKSGIKWLCQCDCGVEITKLTTQLSRVGAGKTGCRNCETTSRSDTKTVHGASKHGKTRLYRTWKMIKVRCTNPKAINFKYYGGKGIKRCAEWDSFEGFRDWAVANGHSDSLVIDRIDPSKNYEPANCRWITASENSRRTTRNAN